MYRSKNAGKRGANQAQTETPRSMLYFDRVCAFLLVMVLAAGADAAETTKTTVSVDSGLLELPPAQSPFKTLLTSPTGIGNAADDYIRAIESVSQRLKVLGVSVKNRSEYKKALPLTSDEAEWIKQGSTKKESAFTPKHLPVRLSGTDPELDITSVQTIANGILEHGRKLEEQGKIDEARGLYEVVVVFGWHLKSEERSLVQHMLGIASESLGCQALQEFYLRQGSPERSKAYGAYRDQEQAGYKVVARKQRLMETDRVFAEQVLKRDVDPIWRREATQYVATYQFQIVPESLSILERAASEDTDETVREAAQWWVNKIRRSEHQSE